MHPLFRSASTTCNSSSHRNTVAGAWAKLCEGKPKAATAATQKKPVRVRALDAPVDILQPGNPIIATTPFYLISALFLRTSVVARITNTGDVLAIKQVVALPPHWRGRDFRYGQLAADAKKDMNGKKPFTRPACVPPLPASSMRRSCASDRETTERPDSTFDFSTSE